MNHENPIEEIWRIREEIGAEHGFDVDRLFAAMREKQKQYGNRLVRVVSRHTSGESPCAKNRRRRIDYLAPQGEAIRHAGKPVGGACLRGTGIQCPQVGGAGKGAPRQVED